jgi:hypothetical protein
MLEQHISICFPLFQPTFLASARSHPQTGKLLPGACQLLKMRSFVALLLAALATLACLLQLQQLPRRRCWLRCGWAAAKGSAWWAWRSWMQLQGGFGIWQLVLGI